MKSIPLTPHDHADQICRDIANAQNLNEADTRHSIIDRVLHDVLSWPRSATRCEEYIAPGFADYVLLGRKESRVLLVEAKRAGTYFSLPDAFIDDDRYRYVQVKTLLTDPIIAEAMLQVYTYCVGSGGEHAAITNGSQWIFFKTFVRSKDWRKEQAFVIVDASYFSLDHSHARKHFSYASITTEASLLDLFGDSQMDHRPRFFPKEKITAYNHEVTSNHLSPVMRPMIERFFGKMNASDSEFMEQCYVNHREYRVSSENVKQLISDSLSPYFRDYSVRDFFDDFGGGEFGNRISSSARDRMKWSPLFGPRG